MYNTNKVNMVIIINYLLNIISSKTNHNTSPTAGQGHPKGDP